MKGDFSRLRFNPKKNYVSVLQQQGRVSLDADANEQCLINDYLRETEADDFVGPWGGPEDDWGFHISVQNGAIQIGKGRYYVNGILCENAQPLSYAQQPFLINPTPSDSILLNDLGLDPTIKDSITVIQVYLEVWRRLVTELDDSRLREPALGRADTTARLQTVWRVVAEGVSSTIQPHNTIPQESKVNLRDKANLPFWRISDSCCKDMTHLSLFQGTPGKLSAQTGGDSGDCSCQPTPAAGYRGLENQLYRVEIHKTGDEKTATFKWSRENGSVVAAVTGISGSQVYVDSLGPDANLGFGPGQWVELTDDSYEFGQVPNQPGNLYYIESTTPDQLSVTVKGAVTQLDPSKNQRMRRWDQVGASATAAGVGLSPGSLLNLENGIQVQFTPGQFESGDYWLIPARTATGQIEWPPCDSDGSASQPPHRIRVFRAPLACITWENKVAVPHDCRRKFLPLTALEVLCSERQGPCTIVPKPGPGWEIPLLNLKPGANADICFPVGDFPLKEPLVLQNLGHLRISGGGAGTLIAASGATAALIFSKCNSVEICDLSAAADQAEPRRARSGYGKSPQLIPGGTLSFVDCEDVSIENAWLICGGGDGRTAACISVQNTITELNQAQGSFLVRIRHCRLVVGRNQDGILLVQVQRAEVEDNVLTSYSSDSYSPPPLNERLKDRVFLGGAVRELVAGLQFLKAQKSNLQRKSTTLPASTSPVPAPSATAPSAPPAPPAPPEKIVAAAEDVVITKASRLNATVTVGKHTVSFRTHPLLKDFWQSYLNEKGPKEFATQRDLVRFLKSAATQFLLQPKLREGNSALGAVWAALEHADQQRTMARGIAVAGEGVQECRILNNSIQDALQGITVGMSNHDRDPHQRYSASVITIAGNQIYVGLPSGAQFYAHHAIFVGNVDSVVVENNYAALAEAFVHRPREEAIRLWGLFGRRLIVRHCHVAGFSTGILVNPLNPSQLNHPLQKDRKPLWLVAENMAEGAGQIVSAPQTVIRQNNFS